MSQFYINLSDDARKLRLTASTAKRPETPENPQKLLNEHYTQPSLATQKHVWQR